MRPSFFQLLKTIQSNLSNSCLSLRNTFFLIFQEFYYFNHKHEPQNKTRGLIPLQTTAYCKKKPAIQAAPDLLFEKNSIPTNKKLCIPIICLLLLFSLSLAAQSDDDSLSLTEISPTHPYFTHYSESKNHDTLLDNLHNPVPFNISGGIGLASYPLVLNLQAQSIGVRYLQLPFQNDIFTRSAPIYYQSYPLYTRIFASAGQPQRSISGRIIGEQFLKLHHSQLIAKKVNITLKYNRYSSPGFYNRQFAFTNNLLLSSHYTTKNERYGYLFHLIYNNLKVEENGGIKNDSLLKEDIFVDKQLLKINLENARRIIKNFDVSFTQFFQLNRKDSLPKHQHLLYQTVSAQSNAYQYIDLNPKAGYYKEILFDSLKTNDSVQFNKSQNEIRYLFKKVKINNLFYLGYRHEFCFLKRRTQDSWFSSHLSIAGVQWNPFSEKIHVQAEAEYIVAGNNENDYRLFTEAIIKLPFGNSLIKLSSNIENRSPDQFMLWNQSNHFNWINVFKKTQTQEFTGRIHVQRWKLFAEASFKNVSDAIYYNEKARPVQYSAKVNYLRLSIGKDLALFKQRLHFNNILHYQILNENPVWRLPQLYSTHQLYYQANLFKSNLQVQLGIQATYISSFKGNTYMPATNIFYNQELFNFGDYCFVDAFFNAQIKPVKFYIKMIHINQGLSGYRYNLMPGYYQPDRAIKFGLIWLFWD